jgi:hypothetical protein
MTDDAVRGALLGRRIAEPGMFDDGLAAAVDALARAAFLAGLAAARLHPPLQDREAFYAGLIQGIQEADLAFAMRVPRPTDQCTRTHLQKSPCAEPAGPWALFSPRNP